MNTPLEMMRVMSEIGVDDLHAVIQGMVDTGEGSLDSAQLIEMYKDNIENPNSFLASAENGRGPIGYVYVVLRKGPDGLIGVVEQIYSEQVYVGRGLYILAEMWAKNEGAVAMRAVTSVDKAAAIARLFGYSIRGIVIGKDL